MSDGSEVHPSTCVRIAQLQPSALFPSLRHIHYKVKYDSSISPSHIFLFQSPLLESLELRNISGNENAIIGPFLATLSSGSQMLNRIVLDNGQLSGDILKK